MGSRNQVTLTRSIHHRPDGQCFLGQASERDGRWLGRFMVKPFEEARLLAKMTQYLGVEFIYQGTNQDTVSHPHSPTSSPMLESPPEFSVDFKAMPSKSSLDLLPEYNMAPFRPQNLEV